MPNVFISKMPQTTEKPDCELNVFAANAMVGAWNIFSGTYIIYIYDIIYYIYYI